MSEDFDPAVRAMELFTIVIEREIRLQAHLPQVAVELKKLMDRAKAGAQ